MKVREAAQYAVGHCLAANPCRMQPAVPGAWAARYHASGSSFPTLLPAPVTGAPTACIPQGSYLNMNPLEGAGGGGALRPAAEVLDEMTNRGSALTRQGGPGAVPGIPRGGAGPRPSVQQQR